MIKQAVRPPLTRTAQDIQAEWRSQAEKLPQETRQLFLDHVWAGKKIGEAMKEAGICLEEAMGVMDMNIVRNTHASLNREAV